MKSIWVFEILPTQKNNSYKWAARLVKGAKILSVQGHYNKLFLWAEVDTGREEYESVPFNVYSTGFSIPDNPGEYLGTVQLFEGVTTVHVYKKLENEL